MFSFRLQRVLDYRRSIEERLQIEMAQLNRRLQQQKETLSAYHSSRSSYGRELDSKRRKGLSAGEFQIYTDYLKGMDLKIRRQSDVVRQLMDERERLRQRLVEASQARRLIERLREKAREAFIESLEKKETALLDEMGLERHLRRYLQAEEGQDEER